jgi:hypothetical protein
LRTVRCLQHRTVNILVSLLAARPACEGQGAVYTAFTGQGAVCAYPDHYGLYATQAAACDEPAACATLHFGSVLNPRPSGTPHVM